MRLVCPNCDAEYEVDSAAIPQSGRDVQCSNCGHAWFQAHPEVLAAADEEEALFGSEAQTVAEAPPIAAPVQSVADVTLPEPEPEPAPPPPPQPPAPMTRNIDESVLAVLREEAEREAAARRSEAKPPALETQTEMPLDPGTASDRRKARLKELAGMTSPALPAMAGDAEEPAPDAETTVEPEAVVRPRRDLFPAIEEVNSTLRSTSDRADDDASAEMAAAEGDRAARAGFGQGFLTLVLIGLILLGLYVFAPLIGAKVPALAGVAQAYVDAVNGLRLWLDGEIRALVGWLRGLEGGTQG